MGQMQNYLIGIVIFSTIVLSFSYFNTSLENTYNPDNTVELSQYERINESYELVDDIYLAVKGGEVSAADSLVRLFNGGLAVMKLVTTGVWSGVTIPVSLMGVAIEEFGIPPAYLTVVILIILLTLLFVIISAVFKHPV